ncbi:hypothetical protein LUZ60_002082 [Juncus effusus]|nr:hypothetical protein LUZ60_002082 [Juncus effusus]
MEKLLPRLAVFALEVSIAAAILLIYFSLNSMGRPLEIFSSGNNSGHTFSNQTKGFNVAAELRNHTILSSHQNETTFQDILPLLRNATTDDKTVIITSVNEAWAAPNSLLDIFLQSFHIGEKIQHLLDHLIIVTVDPKAFERCKTVHKHCYLLKVSGIDFASEKFFMSKDYVELVWLKLALQERILELGYNFLFTDVDILWFRNPFKHISVYADMTTACDVFYGDTNNLTNIANTGFFYVKSTKKTVKMLKYWQEARNEYPPNHEQNIFNMIKHRLVRKLEVNIQFLGTKYFGGFCIHGNDLSEICTMHANCCVHIKNKIHDLRNIVADWQNYTNIPVNDEQRRKSFTWRRPGRCLH